VGEGSHRSEAVRIRGAPAALLDPAKHTVLFVETGGVALVGVVVRIAPRDKLKVHDCGNTRRVEDTVKGADRVLALGSHGFAVEFDIDRLA